MATKIAVLSDTHGLLRPEVLDRIAGCDAIIHGGDINKPEIIDRLKEIAPVYVVRGNNDKEWAENIPESLTFQIEKCRFFVVHNKKFVPKDLRDTDVVIYGHSHKYAEQMVNGVLWLNPGSCGSRPSAYSCVCRSNSSTGNPSACRFHSNLSWRSSS